MNLPKTIKQKQTANSRDCAKTISLNYNLKIPKTTVSIWRWKQNSWAAYQLPDGTKVMSARQAARLVGQPNTDVIDFMQSNNLETINVIIPSKVFINAITLSSIAIYLRHLLEENKLQRNRLSLCREEWEELIDALANPLSEEYLTPNPCFFISNCPPVKANATQIQLEDNVTLEVLVLQTGEYRISCTEGLHCIQANPEWLMNTSPKKAKVFSKMKLSHQTVECRFVTEQGIRQAYTFGCNDWLSIWEYFAKKGNKRAITVLKACAKENISVRVEKVLSRSC
ncbi:MAG: hypothetical protein IGS23_25330 [Rivularia sp. T60_A2020_040]|nr:hypothetical protein [Rivularia sp. T60_A2020_040]